MATGLLTADTSLVVPALAPWHPAHDAARSATAEVERLAWHVVWETISALTRLPHGHASSVDSVVEAVASRFPGPHLLLDGGASRDLMARLGTSHLGGGQVYDALVGFAARTSGASLLSRDRRAERTYRAVGVDYEIIE